MQINRREFFAAACAGIAASAPALAGLSNLGRAATEAGLSFGSAFDREVFADAQWRAVLAQTCRIGSTENAFKFDWLKPKGPTPDFSMADRLTEFAGVNQIALKGTALIWNDWTPPWLNTLSVRELAAEMDRHLETVASRYAGRVTAWDVVNEPFFPAHGRAGGYRKGVWLDAMGPDYVARAFKRVASVDPRATLILNEAFCEQNDDWGMAIRPRLLDLVRRLKGQGIKIDGVGFQAHLKPHLPHDYRRFADYLRQYENLGVTLHITELDVDDSSLPDNILERDAAVAAQVNAFLTPVLPVPAVKSIIAWHLSDKYSWYGESGWYPDAVRKAGGDGRRGARTHFLDTNFKPKPAWNTLARALTLSR
jgi:endo-1,4-beta-xylanase